MVGFTKLENLTTKTRRGGKDHVYNSATYYNDYLNVTIVKEWSARTQAKGTAVIDKVNDSCIVSIC